MKTVFVLVTLVLTVSLSGCGVKEGAEFYALQRQDNQLWNTVSNLQTQVNVLVVENNRMQGELATNSQAVVFLIQDERQQDLKFEKLQDELSRVRKQIKQ